MLSHFRPILYIPSPENQTRAKEEHPVTLKDFNNSSNQDILYESPLINSENTADSHFNIQNKKAFLQELQCNNSMR